MACRQSGAAASGTIGVPPSLRASGGVSIALSAGARDERDRCRRAASGKTTRAQVTSGRKRRRSWRDRRENCEVAAEFEPSTRTPRSPDAGGPGFSLRLWRGPVGGPVRRRAWALALAGVPGHGARRMSPPHFQSLIF